ncbi:MAG: DUF402 domain-containing protein [Lachnospiraceae bacterium]|nr:DUF402 domain-containing protein [Lachnospiraceae bacterium]
MKKKRLNRDGWGFQYFPYYQMRIDCDCFHGLICLLRIVEGEFNYWEMPNAGRVAVCGEGMTWLHLIPDAGKRVITVKYFRDGDVDSMRTNYPSWAREEFCPSLWYVDVMENLEYDEQGIAVYVDKYLDVIFTPEGDVKVDDRDELDDAYEKGELTQSQYEEALAEGEAILKELCEDIPATAKWCAEIRRIVEQKIMNGYKPMYLFHGSTLRFDRLEPQQAHGACDKESLRAIYAAESLREVIPFALPLRWYPDEPGGKRSFSCDAGKTYVEQGYVDINRMGYVYRVKPDTFQKIDEWQWISEEAVEPLEVLAIPGKNMLHTVTFSKEARESQNRMFPANEV